MAKRTAPSATPRMIDIAARAGVSRMAVSAVLMGTGQGRIAVSAETASDIRRIAEELGYRPNPAARLLASKRSDIIAVVAKDWRNHLTQSTLSWLHQAAEDHNYRIMTARSASKSNSLERLIRDVRSGWIGGLVYLAYQNESEWEEVAGLLAGVPGAVTAVGSLQIEGTPAIVSNVAAGARDSVRHLAQRGCSRMVFVTEEDETPAIRARIDACRQAAAEFGLAFDSADLIVETKDWRIDLPAFYPRFDELARSILKTHQADAVICDTDFNAAALIKAFRRLGVSIPNEIRIVGWGNLQFAAAMDPSLTTVSYRLPDLLERVVVQLEECMALNEPRTEARSRRATDSAQVELIDPQLIVRESA